MNVKICLSILVLPPDMIQYSHLKSITAGAKRNHILVNQNENKEGQWNERQWDASIGLQYVHTSIIWASCERKLITSLEKHWQNVPSRLGYCFLGKTIASLIVYCLMTNPLLSHETLREPCAIKRRDPPKWDPKVSRGLETQVSIRLLFRSQRQLIDGLMEGKIHFHQSSLLPSLHFDETDAFSSSILTQH